MSSSSTSSMNKDEAIRCLAIAQKHKDARNYSSAKKFCLKSIALFDTPEAQKLLDQLDSLASESTSTTTETHPSASGAHQRHKPTSNGTAGGMGGDKREYTHEQHTVVKRVRACKVTEYYQILSLTKDCDEADIKKAYRKLALALHPDKNGAPGADEAFKMVSKAFQVLSDPQKRAIFDQSGGDPEDRSSGFPSSRASGSGGFGGGGPMMFDGELNPEDLFNMFFGGGGPPGFGGGGFGGGGPTVFSFGPGGFRTTRMGGAAAGFRQQQQQQQRQQEPTSTFYQLLPLIILFGFSLLSALPSLFSTPPVPDPRFSFSKTPRYDLERETVGLGVKYHVNPVEIMSHPVLGAELVRDGIDLRQQPPPPSSSSSDKKGPAMRKFESGVDNIYHQDVYAQCQRGLDRKERLKEQEVGIFGIGTDWEKVKTITEEKIPMCEELERINKIAGRRR